METRPRPTTQTSSKTPLMPWLRWPISERFQAIDNPWPKDRRYVYRRVQDGRGRGARVLSAKGGLDCRPGVLPRQDALWTRGAGCPTDRFAGLLLARAPRSEQYRVTLRASCGESAPTALPSVK